MAHAQKRDLVFQRNGRVHLYRRGCQFSRLLAAEACASAVVMLDRPCPIQCKTAGYPLHSPLSPSLLLPRVSVCHQIPFPLYLPKYVCSAQYGFFCALFMCFPATLLRYFLNDSEMVPFAPIITGIAFVFTLHMRCISVVRSLYFRIFCDSFF